MEENMIITKCTECVLRNNICFIKAEQEEIEFIQSLKSNEIVLDAGKQLIEQGENCDFFYTLKSGWAFRYVTLPDGKRQILNFLLPGDIIGMQAEINHEISHGVETLTDATFCAFPRKKTLDIYKNFPSLGYQLTWLVAHEELIVDENLVAIGRKNALQRIAMLLVSLFKRASVLGMLKEESLYFPISQQHIADALGLSLVHTNKTMAKLKTYGVHELVDSHIKIKDLSKVEKLAEYYALPNQKRPLL